MSSNRKRYYRPEISSLNIPEKANRILNLVLITLILILLRIWHLSIVQHEDKLEESRKPQRKVVIEPAKRGTIRDRFNIPLAINKIQYQAAIVYSQLRQIPTTAWEKDESGKKVKRYKRKEYITKLANLLAEELNLDPVRVEDLIYSKASFYNQFPYVVKEEISEREYYRLRMLEKDWLGIHVQSVPKRHYPLNRVGADVLGFMGSINRQEYEKIIREIKEVQNYIKACDDGEEADLPRGVTSYEQASQRLKELEAHAYTINDSVGKMGVEGRFEQFLRGYHGKKSFYSDSRGNFLRELPGTRHPLSGDRILLTLSAELQEYAEKLLAQNERIREPLVSDSKKKSVTSVRQPWIKGGAVVAMDPNNCEVLALASYPRFDPNDYIVSGNPDVSKQKRANILRWFESEAYIGQIWDQKRPLERERYDDEQERFFEEEVTLDWETYLKFILPSDSPISNTLARMDKLSDAILLQNHVEKILKLSGQDNIYLLMNSLYPQEPHQQYKIKTTYEAKNQAEASLKENADEVASLKKIMDKWLEGIHHNYDKVLFVDLCRMLVRGDYFSPLMIQIIGNQSPKLYRDASASMATIIEIVRSMSRELFRELTFLPWRKENEKSFLKQKRDAEKAAKTYPRPYIDYLDAEEKNMFQKFWEEYYLQLVSLFLKGRSSITLPEELDPYKEHFTTWHRELKSGAHHSLDWQKAYLTLQKATQGLTPRQTVDYLKTLRSFQDLTRPLLGSYRHLRRDPARNQHEKHLAAAFYPLQGFGYGRSQGYRQATTQGSIFKLITAYEALVQRFRQMDPAELSVDNLNPLEIIDATHRHGKDLFLGFTQDGVPIPQHYKGGRLVRSSASGIGKTDLLKALETSSNPYFSLLAVDIIKSPEDLAKAARVFSYGAQTGIDLPAEIPGKVPDDLSINQTGLYSMAIGQHTLVVTPLQTAVALSAIANGGKVLKPNIVKVTIANRLGEDQGVNLVKKPPVEIRRSLFMPDLVHAMLLEGMRRVVHKQLKDTSSIRRLSRFYRDYPEAISDYLELKDQFIGKTSTAESMENLDQDRIKGTNLYTHVWFGGISFNTDILGIKNDTIVFRDENGQPELVVVVYLKYGAYGKEAAPLAAQIVKKWREIKAKYQNDAVAPFKLRL